MMFLAPTRGESSTQFIVTAEEMKRYDTNTIETIGIPALVLMERAALAAAEAAKEAVRCESPAVLVLAGTGNNGADGLAVARLLAQVGMEVEVVCCGDPERATPQWQTQRQILTHYPVSFCPEPRKPRYDLLVDALFGVGLSRPVEREHAALIRRFNETPGFKLALDIPSGIHSDDGRVMGTAVQADHTICFAFLKRGLCLSPGRIHAGRITVADIGIDQAAFLREPPAMFAYICPAAAMLPPREASANKGGFGKLTLAAGSLGMTGAAILSTRAAMQSGLGMVRVITPEHGRLALHTAVPEAMVETRACKTVPDEQSAAALKAALDWADALAIGPGLGREPRAHRLLTAFLTESRLPLVLDADALNLLSEDPLLMEEAARQGREGRALVLTPHMGELARLLGQPIEAVLEDKAGSVRLLAQRLFAVVVGKDDRTLIAHPNRSSPLCINLNGNDGMATAGSGDVLTGLLAGLLTQGMDPFAAACAAVRIHGEAGDLAAASLGPHAVTAGEIASHLHRVFTAPVSQSSK